ncbi:YlxR family protein [Dermacoccus nishinomiyaensis]|nr:YlxR family protein [Dermacoccus nishinomiyaensis]MCI0153026.1 YlxR family protein [Dermacoccus nishinomiyaensis]NHC31402.1 YlxR family protein [Dermacoccus nishinomiyaensis]PZO99626.1 MAG: DUF448 domain-containing protein [Dermacoccus nishinomiyaensis]QQY23977.1 YlxR family protein [Dermacoccus nishinomiyaensis]TJZ98567.1 YlxR family protein [Dermacoccus nishinomiyaensis]
MNGDRCEGGVRVNVPIPNVELSRPAEPQRTCIGCRGKGGRSVLLRIAVSEDGATLVLDSRKAMPGRGAWLHADTTCLEQATKRRAWARALRLHTAVHTATLQEHVAAEIARLPSPDGEHTMTESGFDAMSNR